MRPDVDRIAGGLLALAVGDALGWPMEDRSNRVGGTASIVPDWSLVAWERREGGSYGPHVQPVAAGSISDDTQLALAVARSALQGADWWRYFTEVELPVWTLYERGGGGATKRAAQSWLRGRAPWDPAQKPDALHKYFQAGGNGAAMRCLPHCVVADTWDELRERLDADAITTHGHPRAILGSRIYGWCVHWALRRRGGMRYGELLDRIIDARTEWATPPRLPGIWGEAAHHSVGDYGREWERTVDEVLMNLSLASDGMQHGAVAIDGPVLDQLGAFGAAGGAGTVTAIASVFLATRYLSQPQQGLMAAAFARGADTDTLAAMTGGLLGALIGADWLWPLDSQVQDSRYARDLANQLANRQPANPIPWTFNAKERSSFYRWLDIARPGDEGELPPFGPVQVREINDYAARQQFVRSWELETWIGQSLLIKRYDKGRDNQPRWVSVAPKPQTQEPPNRSLEGDRPQEPRIGLVLPVRDVAQATVFYTAVVGLTVRRATDRYTSFGWLALEPADRAGQLSLTPEREVAMPAIRIYVAMNQVPALHARFIDFGLETRPVEHHGQSGFRSSDLDGYPIEVLARNGAVPPTG